MAAGVLPDSWQEVGIITIQRAGGTARQFAAITDEIEINEPDYPGESVPNSAGGRLWVQKPQEDGEVTLKLYPIAADEGDNFSFMQQFHTSGAAAYDSSQPIKVQTSYTAGISKLRDTFAVAILWTDDSTVTSAFGTGATSAKTMIRWYCKLARVISHKSKFDPENGLVTNVTLKFPPMNKAGTTKTFAWESTNDPSTAPLPAITYTSVTDL